MYVYPFDCICFVPPPTQLPDGLWTLPPAVIEKWDGLSFELMRMTHRMIDVYKLRAFAPYSPRGWGYWKKFKSRAKAIKISTLAAEWFHVWAGLITYLIRTIEQEHPKRAPDSVLPPNWDVWMERQGYSHAWIDGWKVMSSNDIPRAGSVWGTLFSDEVQARRGLKMPPFNSHLAHQVPVWFEWDRESLERLAEGKCPEAWVDLIPPPHLRALVLEIGVEALQARSTTSNAGSIVMQPEPKGSSISPWSKECREARHQSIIKVLEGLEAREAERIARETPAEKHTRLMRQAKPELKTAAVYLWETDDDNPNKLVRTTVTQRQKEYVMEIYNSSQMRFFAAQNTWHVCEDLVAGSFVFDAGGDSDKEDDYYECYEEPPPPPSDRFVENVPPPCPIADSTLATERFQKVADNEESSRYEELFQRITRDVRETFGFCCPIPLPERTQPLTDSQRDAAQFLRSVGWSYGRNEKDADRFLRTSIAGCIYELYLTFVGEKDTTTTPLFDLNLTCPQPLAVKTDTFKYLTVLEGDNDLKKKVYMINLQGSCPVGVYSPVVALAVCRKKPRNNEDVCKFLYDIGAPFQTFIDTRTKWIGEPHRFHFAPPERPADFVYDEREYMNYLDTMHSLLRMTRMRATVLRGGFVWRLCSHHVRMDHIMEGPSSSSLLQFTHDNIYYYDDRLTRSEEQMIVGSYSVPDSRGGRMLISWWPPPDLWDDPRTGENYTFWTEYNERYYQDRLQSIREGKAKPLSRGNWMRMIRGTKQTRRWNQVLAKRSEAYIQDLMPDSR